MTQPARGVSEVRVLVVEDEAAIRRVLVGYLQREDFAVSEAADGVQAVALAREGGPEVIVLDLGLPGIDGVEVCRQVRTFSDAYIIMLTARAEEIDKLIGLSVGADDYLTKPFSPRELVARVRAMLRRPRAETAPSEDQVRRFGDLTVDPQAREVTVAGRIVELTRTEFDILEALSSQPRRVFSRRALVTDVWGSDWFGDDHLVDVHIAHIRAKLAAANAAGADHITTVRGVGYRVGPP